MVKKIFYDWMTEQLKVSLPNTSINDVKNIPISAIGLDSLELLDLIMEIEDYYEVEIAIEDLDKNITIAAINALIEQLSSHKL